MTIEVKKDYTQNTADGLHKVRNVGGQFLIATRHNLSLLGGVYITSEEDLELVLTHIAEMFEEHRKIANDEIARKKR